MSTTRWPAAALFLIASAFALAKTGRDALFIQQDGLLALPHAYIGIAVLSVPLAVLVLGLLRFFGGRRVRLVLPLGTAAVIGLSALVVRPGGGAGMTLFFMSVPLLWGVVFASTWLLAADLADGAGASTRTRHYRAIGGGALAGGLAGGAIARLLASSVEARTLLVIAGLLLLGATFAIHRAQIRRGSPPRPAATERSAVMSWPDTWSSAYARALLLAGLGASLAGILIEFQFYLAAAIQGGGPRDQTAFFANYYTALNGAALMTHLWIAPWLERRMGVTGSLLVLPVALIAGGVGLAASASAAMAAAVRVTEGGLKASIHRVAWEQAFLPLRGAGRATVKVVIDGMATRVAEGAVAVGLLLWMGGVTDVAELSGRHPGWIPAALLAAIGVWLLAIARLRRHGGIERSLGVTAAPPACCPVTLAFGRAADRNG